MAKGSSEADDLEAWQNAQGYAGLFGDIPATFSSVVRSLKVDSDSGKLSDGSLYLTQRLLRSKAVLSPFYYGVLEFAKYSKIEVGPVPSLISKIKPIDLSALLATIYLYRRALKVCPQDEWQYISPHLTVEGDLGGRIGYSMPAIGFQTGILTGVLKWFALGSFLLHDKKGFVEYRRLLKQRGNELDFQWEKSRWGCTSSQVAAVFLQSFGFGVDAVSSLVTGLSDAPGEAALKDKGIYRVHITSVWIKSLRTTCSVPDISHRGEFYPDAKDLEQMIQDAQRLKDQGSSKWLDQDKEAIPAKELNILLPGGVAAVAASADEVEEDDALEPA